MYILQKKKKKKIEETIEYILWECEHVKSFF